MKRLITNTGSWGTGSGTVAEGVMKELKRKGHETKMFFPDSGIEGPGYEKHYSQPDLYHIVRFPIVYKGTYFDTFPLMIPDTNPRSTDKAPTYKQLSDRQFYTYIEFMKKETKKILEEFKPDVIECQHIWIMDYIVSSLGYKFISVAHHSDQLGFAYDERMQPMTIQSAKSAEYIFAISEYVRQQIKDLYAVNDDKVITVYNGYDQDVFKPMAVDKKSVLSRFGINGKEHLPVITFCGKISKTKGIDLLLKANHILQNNKEVLVVLLGSGVIEERFSSDERKDFCMHNVVHVGHRSPEEVALLHNIATLSVLPSRSEGFGIAAIEAMGCGIPLVATKVGGITEFAVGELIEIENYEALANGILDILNISDQKYQELCDLSIKTARKYSWSNTVDKRLYYYNRLVETKGQ